MPFNVKLDVLEGLDLERPWRVCLICGVERREVKPFVCGRCREQRVVGKGVEEGGEREWWGLHVWGLIPVPLREGIRSVGSDIEGEMLRVLGRMLGLVYRDKRPSGAGEVKWIEQAGRTVSGGWWYFELDRERGEMVQELYELVSKATLLAFETGKREGESFLQKLAAGEVSMEELNAA